MTSLTRASSASDVARNATRSGDSGRGANDPRLSVEQVSYAY